VTARDVLFAGFALLSAASGVAAVTNRQVVHAALWLVVALGGLTGVYLVLGAELVALVQLLVYVGAVVVLVLFVLMLTRAPIGVSRDLDAGPGQRLAALGAGLGVAGLLGGVLMEAVGRSTVAVDDRRGRAGALGEVLFGGWLLPFELLSVLLLAALVAALVVSRGQERS
jgi:NADH-quinone oxidoreductase subunit J